MPHFLFAYKGDATDMSAMTEEQIQTEMAAWGAWMQGIGEALVEMGTPFGSSASVIDDGSAGTPAPLTGYSIVQAEDISAARNLTKGHPFLREGQGNYAVDIYELMPVPGM